MRIDVNLGGAGANQLWAIVVREDSSHVPVPVPQDDERAKTLPADFPLASKGWYAIYGVINVYATGQAGSCAITLSDSQFVLHCPDVNITVDDPLTTAVPPNGTTGFILNWPTSTPAIAANFYALVHATALPAVPSH